MEVDRDLIIIGAGAAGLSAAQYASRANMRTLVIEEMAAPGQEMVIGGLRDPQFGPLVMVGLGGIFVEVMRDVSVRLLPLTDVNARAMIERIKGYPLLAGARRLR